MRLIAPITINELLDQTIAKDPIIPPMANSAYIISRKPWNGMPDESSEVLYVGGNTSTSARFRVRVGELLSVLFGFYNDELSGGHSGAKSIRAHCIANQINPKTLYISWVEDGGCPRCLENRLYLACKPLLNKSRPGACSEH